MDIQSETLEQSQALNEVLLDLSKAQRKTNKSLVKVIFILVLSFTLIICSMVVGFFYYEAQFETVTKELDTTMITLETEVENVIINNVEKKVVSFIVDGLVCSV